MAGESREHDDLVVSALREARVIDFEALGRVIADVGPKTISIADDPDIRWCGSDLRIYRWPGRGLGLEDIAVLRELVRELRIR
jgi:hypothetical protein